jgi:hypothetical protein
MTEREIQIKNYIDGYNQFDVLKMIRDFDEQIIFENVQNGQVTMTLDGLESFKQQAEQAKSFFLSRKQTIQSIHHNVCTTEVNIHYSAILAMDFPNGMKKGQLLELNGKSIFEFCDSKIVKLTDIS